MYRKARQTPEEMSFVFKVGQSLATGFVLGFLSYHIYRRFRFRPGSFNYCKYVLVIRTDTNLGKAETAELCAEVTLESYRRATVQCPDLVKVWESVGQPKIALRLDKDYEKEAIALRAKAEDLGLVAVILSDRQGRPSGLGIGPAPEELVNTVTGHLKLMG